MKQEALELAKYLDRLNGYMDMPRDILDITQPSSAMIRRLVEELDKQGEPVAWSCWNDDMPSAIITFTEPDKYDWMSIKPLYKTPQTKPLKLSYEQINQVASRFSLNGFSYIDFAEAILEEASK